MTSLFSLRICFYIITTMVQTKYFDFFLYHENRNDGTEFGGSIYQKVNEKVETSINLAWTAGSNNTRFGIAAKYKLDCRTSLAVRMCYQMCLLLGFHLSN